MARGERAIRGLMNARKEGKNATTGQDPRTLKAEVRTTWSFIAGERSATLHGSRYASIGVVSDGPLPRWSRGIMEKQGGLTRMLASAAIGAVSLVPLLPVLGLAQQVPANRSASALSQKTLFVNCQGEGGPKHVLSPVSLSEDEKWRAYVEVDVQSDLGCLHTTRLWVARGKTPYQVVYLMPPKRTAVENGMEILGWAKNSRMLLMMTEEWQMGSDAPDKRRVLAIDAGTGMVYEPELEAMLKARKDKQCAFRVTDAGFSDDGNVNILVRVRFYTATEVDETEEDVPLAKRCGNAEETWSFNFATGEIRQVADTQPLHLFKKFLPVK